MRWLVVVVVCAPALALARTPTEAETIAREQIAPKLDLMCGMHMTVRYDTAAFGTSDIEDACEEPLRYLYYACQRDDVRKTLKLSHLSRYECRAALARHDKLTVADGTITFFAQPEGNDMNERLNELAGQLHTNASAFSLGMDSKISFHQPDKKWETFVAASVPKATSTDYCLVGDKKIPLPPTGDPLAPPHTRVLCERGGQATTDMSADGTGFVTRLDGTSTHFDRYKLGAPDGESWVREKGIVRERVLFDGGNQIWRSVYDSAGNLRTHWNRRGAGKLELDEQLGVTELECNEGADRDPVLRAWCGFDKPRRVKIFDPRNPREVIMTNGKARLVE